MVREWWEPELCDDEYFSRLRADYPEKAGWTDEELQDYFADGRKYSVVWDNASDAYAQFEKLADEYLKLKNATN